jgi:hypothetical protein
VERGWGVNILEDARHCSVLSIPKYFVHDLHLPIELRMLRKLGGIARRPSQFDSFIAFKKESIARLDRSDSDTIAKSFICMIYRGLNLFKNIHY